MNSNRVQKPYDVVPQDHRWVKTEKDYKIKQSINYRAKTRNYCHFSLPGHF
jgi:hypothetical protein